MRHALHHHATAIVIAHNHPKGIAHPSLEDKQLTIEIENACALLEIRLLDHVIIASEQNFSFAEHQLLKKVR